MSEKKFVMNNQVWVPRTPIDGNGASYGGNFQFACMKNAAHATFVWLFGNLAADATISIQQAKNIGGGSAKAYTIDYLYQQHTTAGTAQDQTRVNKVTVNASTYSVTNTSPAMDNYIIYHEMETEQLDVQNGFDCVRPHFVGGSGASLITMFVIFSNLRFRGDLADGRYMPSVLKGENEAFV